MASCGGAAAGGIHLTDRLIDRLIVASPALIPIVWSEILKSHIQVHVRFTYRSIPIAVGVIEAASAIVLRPVVDAGEPTHATGDARRDRQQAVSRPPSGSGD